MGNDSKKFLFFFGILLLGIYSDRILPVRSWASQDSPDKPVASSENQTISPEPWYKRIEAQWGGRLRILGSVSSYDDDTIFAAVQNDPYYDGAADFRLTNVTYLNPRLYFAIDYEAILSGGDARRVQNELQSLLPDTIPDDFIIIRGPVTDELRFFDLTKTISEGNRYILYNRLDRLALTLEPEWGMVRIGRQAVTWGNGFLFNPMDLFNPFAPTQIDRDYKIGDDMVYTLYSLGQTGDFQLLYVPRRDLESGNVEWNQSSLAGKLHFAVATTEFDVMAAAHYGDFVTGFGSRGYLGDAAWRLDATWTFLLQEDSDQDGYLSLVANMDYSWVWWRKNFYGFIELYFDGLGEENYSEAITNQALVERIVRGEIFTLGRKYLSGSVKVELHPLFNVFLTSINNIADPSGIFQPYAVWDLTKSFQLTFGGTIPWGGSETEFGGFTMPGTEFQFQPSVNAFLWLTYYF